MWPENIPIEDDDEPRSRGPGLGMVLITLLLILAILSTLIWPLLQSRRPDTTSRCTYPNTWVFAGGITHLNVLHVLIVFLGRNDFIG